MEPENWVEQSTSVFLWRESSNIYQLPSMFDPEAIFTGNDYTSEAGKNYPMNKVLSIGVIVNL